jgi:hypothetical protein
MQQQHAKKQRRYGAALPYHGCMTVDQLKQRLQAANLYAMAHGTGINIRTLRRIKNTAQVPSIATMHTIQRWMRRNK